MLIIYLNYIHWISIKSVCIAYMNNILDINTCVLNKSNLSDNKQNDNKYKK